MRLPSGIPGGMKMIQQTKETGYEYPNGYAKMDGSGQAEQVSTAADITRDDIGFDEESAALANGQHGAGSSGANSDSMDQNDAIREIEDSQSDQTADLDGLRRNIQGEPNVDYPILATVPMTGFSCGDRGRPGYYGDMEARCQVFHICQAENRLGDSFLCPNGTIFSQKDFVCVWWWQYDCAQTEQDWKLNANLFSGNTLDSPVDDVERLVKDDAEEGQSMDDQDQVNQVQMKEATAVSVGSMYDTTDAPIAMLNNQPEGCQQAEAGAYASSSAYQCSEKQEMENAMPEAQLLSPAAIARGARFSARFGNRRNNRGRSAARRPESTRRRASAGRRASQRSRNQRRSSARRVFGRTRSTIRRSGRNGRNSRRATRTSVRTRFGRRH
ncbi:hypothetical protein HDE_00717 [Halotydeus destructor]|nr:hypothetical protein HDE_00717 [Halotydeus destructor]